MESSVKKRNFAQNIALSAAKRNFSNLKDFKLISWENNVSASFLSEGNRHVVKVFTNFTGFTEDSELYLRAKMPGFGKFLRRCQYIGKIGKYDYGVFEFLDGQTVFEKHEKGVLVEEECIRVANFLLSYCSYISKTASYGYGPVNEKLLGKYASWYEALWLFYQRSLNELSLNPYFPKNNLRQIKLTCDVFKGYSVSPTLIPVDLNLKNVLISKNGDIKLLDVGNIWAGDPLYSLAVIASSNYGNPIWNFVSKKINKRHEEVIFKYAFLISNNVMAYVSRINPSITLKEVPWGNNRTFFDLSKEFYKKSYMEISNNVKKHF